MICASRGPSFETPASRAPQDEVRVCRMQSKHIDLILRSRAQHGVSKDGHRLYFTPIITASVSMKSKSPLCSCGRANARKAAEPLRNMDISSSLVPSPTFC